VNHHWQAQQLRAAVPAAAAAAAAAQAAITSTALAGEWRHRPDTDAEASRPAEPYFREDCFSIAYPTLGGSVM